MATRAGKARTAWKGSLSFGLVNVGVGLYPATQDRSVHFNQFEEGTSDRIRYRKVNERTGDEVDASRIVRAVDLGGSDYVLLTDEELEAVEPERSRTIEITGFVDLDEIDPLYYRASYYLAPEGEGSTKAYALLRKAMREANRVGVATMVMRNKEHLVAVRPDGEILMLETMYFADEIRPRESLPGLPDEKELGHREVDMAKLLIETMATGWDPEKYHDTYREQLGALVDRKRQGREIVTETPTEEHRAPVIDLMEALNASVRRAGGERSPRSPRGPKVSKERTGERASARPASTGKKATGKRAPAKRAPGKRKATSKASVAKSARKRAS